MVQSLVSRASFFCVWAERVGARVCLWAEKLLSAAVQIRAINRILSLPSFYLVDSEKDNQFE